MNRYLRADVELLKFADDLRSFLAGGGVQAGGAMLPRVEDLVVRRPSGTSSLSPNPWIRRITISKSAYHFMFQFDQRRKK